MFRVRAADKNELQVPRRRFARNAAVATLEAGTHPVGRMCTNTAQHPQQSCAYLHLETLLTANGELRTSDFIPNDAVHYLQAHPTAVGKACTFGAKCRDPTTCKFLHTKPGAAAAAGARAPTTTTARPAATAPVSTAAAAAPAVPRPSELLSVIQVRGGPSLPVSAFVQNPGLDAARGGEKLVLCCGHPRHVSAAQCTFLHLAAPFEPVPHATATASAPVTYVLDTNALLAIGRDELTALRAGQAAGHYDLLVPQTVLREINFMHKTNKDKRVAGIARVVEKELADDALGGPIKVTTLERADQKSNDDNDGVILEFVQDAIAVMRRSRNARRATDDDDDADADASAVGVVALVTNDAGLKVRAKGLSTTVPMVLPANLAASATALRAVAPLSPAAAAAAAEESAVVATAKRLAESMILQLPPVRQLCDRVAASGADSRVNPHIFTEASAAPPIVHRFLKAARGINRSFATVADVLSAGSGTFDVVFHGTCADAARAIMAEGFDPSLRCGQMHGPGEYFDVGTDTAQGYVRGGICLVVAVLRGPWVSASGNIRIVANPLNRSDGTYCLPLAVFGKRLSLEVATRRESDAPSAAVAAAPTAMAQAAPAPPRVVEYRADDGTWHAVAGAMAAAVVQAAPGSQLQVQCQCATGAAYVYDVDLAAMTQRNRSTGVARPIRVRS